MIRAAFTVMVAIVAVWISTGSAHASDRSGSSGWTIVASYPLPEGASGLAWDGTDLYCGIYGVNGSNIYRIDPDTGAHVLAFVGPQEDAFGLTYDGQYLWTTDHPGSSSTPAIAMQLDWNGNLIDQFSLPDHYMSGIAYDNGDFWVSRYYDDPGHLYRMTPSGFILNEFDGPDDQPWDLAVQGDSVWIADYWGDTLYRVDATTGELIESHASEGIDPAGIAWDGQYLWYCDNGENYSTDLLYKIDLQGGGSPEILIADTSHAFGNVAIGDTASWTVIVQNTGTAALMIDDVTFGQTGGLTCTANFPVIIPAGGVAGLDIEYAPSEFGAIDTTATVISNDPVNPNEALEITGHGVYPGPTIHLDETFHGYGQVRIGAHTRWFIDIANHGEQTLVIQDVTSDNANFYIDPGVDLPITLGTLATTQVGVWFNPPDECLCTGEITITSTATNQDPVAVQVTGSSVEATYPMGTALWSSFYTDDWDNSFKAIAAIPDVNGDGRPDVIGCSEDNAIRCFNGNAHESGDVLWTHEIYSGNIYSDKGLDVIEDVDGDGIHEVVVGATGGARLIRMLSGRTGEEIWSYHTDAVGDGGWVYQVDGSRDFSGDGVPDIVASAGDDGQDTGPKRVYCLDGLTGQPHWQHPLGGPGYAAIAVDDFTGDGVPDVLAGAANASENQGRAVGINGANGLQSWSFETNGSSVWSLAQVGDVSSDGVNDVMVGDFIAGEYHALDAKTGNELYAGGGLGIMTGFKRLEDVDGDGHPEIVPEHFGNFVRVISGKTGATIWSTPVVDNPSVISAIADVSGDGINDLVVGTLFSTNYTYFMDGVDGTVLQSADYGTPLDAIAVLPDVVGDGSWELVAGGRNGLITCISGGRDALVSEPADVNDDGVVDVNDVLLVISEWGATDSPADANDDGIVDVNDVLLVIGAWTVP
ncbi:MAG: choice-of-anchor D domain-containing protein [Phycisphaerales bacterium]|nr:choice-of-anchor D domain-containing protein [Phycisphaerales bacterium]